MRTRVIVAIVAVGLGAWLLMSRDADLFVTVQPLQEAVVLENGEVVGTLGPGMHQLDLATEQSAVVYDTLFDRAIDMPGMIDVAGCPANVSVAWRIGDVEAFHRAGAEDASEAPIRAEVARYASELTEFGDDPRTEMQVFLWERMTGPQGDGRVISSVSVSLGDCEPSAR